MTFSELPYKRYDKDELLSGIEALTSRLKTAESADDQFAILKEKDKLAGSFMTMATIANIRNTVDTRDEFYEKEREYYDDLEPLYNEKLQEFNKALVASPYRAELEGKTGSLLFQNIEMELKSFSPEIIPLVQEENKLCAQYQKLYASAQVSFQGKTCTIPQLVLYKQSPDREVRKAAYEAEGSFFDEHQQEFDELFDKLVKNRTEQAKKLGFDSFLELGYLRRQRNCYGPDGVANFRRQVVEEIVPIISSLKKKQAERIGVDSLKFYDDLFIFPDGNPVPQGTPDEIMAAGKQMYTEMSPETAEFIKAMFDMYLFDVLAKEGKAPGGYCTDLEDYKVPFIFSNFNGTAGDVDVLTHEAGHAFAFYTAAREIDLLDLRTPTMDGAETHSMSMEFLTEPWHELFFKGQTAKYKYAHAEDALIFLPYGCEVDHFQEIAYSNPGMTPAERNEAWAKLEKLYRPHVDHADLPFYGRGAGWQRQLHIYLYPFYYIDYCMAQTVALQFWVESMKDREMAWDTYLKFVRQGGTKTFSDLVKSVGLLSPLEDGSLKSISSVIGKWLEENEI